MGAQWNKISKKKYIFYGKGNTNCELGTVFFVQKRMLSAVKRVEFVSDRMSYIILRGCWCHIFLPKLMFKQHKIEDVKVSFYKTLECVFSNFLKYNMKILIGDFDAKVGKEAFLTPQYGLKIYAKLVMILEVE
jgi:hypothetical protein